tara:strand:- start:229 stop:525 length:297 start_codon:yes stop_codon:yes gene_type:complete
MKVNVTYSVDLKEVPLEIDRLFRNAIKDLHLSLKNLEALDSNSIMEFIEGVHDFRKGLYDFDSRLDECHTMGRGYIAALGGALESKAQNPIGDQNEGG